MKKILCAALASAVFAAAICGCSGQKSPSSGSSSDQPSGKTATYDEAPTENSVSTTGNKVHIKDSTLGDIWITELEGVAKNTLKAENFTSDATFKYYSEDGKAASEEGIDISSYTGEIDWKKVKAAGVDFAMVRLGGRGYGEDGSLYSDDKALEYIKGAQAENIKVGGYFFSQATTSDEAAEEAEYVKDLLDGTKLEYPIAFDWEIIKDENARTDSVSIRPHSAEGFRHLVRRLHQRPRVLLSVHDVAILRNRLGRRNRRNRRPQHLLHEHSKLLIPHGGKYG